MGKKKHKRPESESEALDRGDSEAQLVNGCSPEKKKRKKKKKLENEEIEGEKREPVSKPTVSIAVSGSIIDNAQSLELATRLAGQIARAATIFRIDEVVVFDSGRNSVTGSDTVAANNSDEDESGAAFLIRILKYLETPQYLRKALFPKHNNLRFVGMLPPLDAPHHLRKHEWGPYREGVTLTQRERAPDARGTPVDVGLSKNVVVDEVLEPGIRVTVAMGTDRNLLADLPRQVASSSRPVEEGLYWGYRVRYASCLSGVFKESSYKGGYDHVIGTSEHGMVAKSSELKLPSFRHLLIAFGGLAGLEESIEEDNSLKGKDPREIFSSYLNTCPLQGSRTIRTEEAIFISLQYFQEPISRAMQVAAD
ncbi:putative methyltransferase C9orf114 [Momordica charantia]|uniref:Methyltransferase C9orf114 n=1 Tax=Momordica charantia TaxID=3673 RepID=A0A6J1C971_MOMCH|nr:putative methyltransferase C9orf114 [Momordica charantia]